MVGKRHANLVRDIENYQDVLCQNSKLSSDEYIDFVAITRKRVTAQGNVTSFVDHASVLI